jgi:hypothetical protein
MKRRMSLALLALASCAHPNAVLRQSKAVAGGAAWDGVRTVYTRATLEIGGLEGTAESWQDVTSGHYADQYELGPARGAGGFDGAVVWSQDTSGQVREEQGESERLGAINELYRRSYSYWFPGRHAARVQSAGERRDEGQTYDVLRIQPEGGRPFELWVNRETHQIDRTVEESGIQTVTTYYSDYRDVDGLQIPFKMRVNQGGDAKYDQHIEVVEVKLNVDIDASRFAKPAPPPPDFEIAGGQSSVTLPFRLVNNHIYVSAQLNGKTVTLLLDTGGSNVITPAAAAQLGLETEGAMEGRGVGEKSVDVALTRVDALALGGAVLSNQLFAVLPLEDLWQRVEGVDAAGLIGYEVFKRFVVHIDYERSAVTLTLPSASERPTRGTVVPFELDGHLPAVHGAIDGVAGKFHIDTGSRSTVDLMRPFVEKHHLDEHFAGGVEGVSGWGVGGPARSRAVRAELLRLGEVEIQQPIVELSRQEKGAFSDRYVAGNVGAGILKRFNVTFDYGRQIMVLEPNTNSNQPFEHDRSGMWINAVPGGFEVVDVISDGPAAQAGLQAGDRIVAIDGAEASELELPAVRLRLRQDEPGTVIRLRVERQDGSKQVELTLRDLVK